MDPRPTQTLHHRRVRPPRAPYDSRCATHRRLAYYSRPGHPECDYEGCDSPVNAWGYCERHAQRLKRLFAAPVRPVQFRAP